MKRNNYLLFVFIISMEILVGCRPSINNKEDLVNYVNNPENGLMNENVVNGIKISCNYLPSTLLNNKLKKDMEYSKTDSLPQFIYFRVSFSKNNKELLKQLKFSLYSEMVQVFSFRMANYISIAVSGKEPIIPVDCFFQQTYGLSNANELLVVFKSKELESVDDIKIMMKEFGLGLGNQVFNFKTEQIKEISKVII